MPQSPIVQVFGLLQAGDAAGALQAASRLAAAQPANARAHLAMGLALRALGRGDEALAAFDAALRVDANDYAATYERGVTLAHAGRNDEAVQAFERATTLRPGFAPAHAALGLQAFAQRDWPRAIAALERALALDTDNPGTAVNLGLALAESGDTPRARELLAAAAARHPEVAVARHALGWTLHKAGEASEALPHLRLAVEKSGDPAWRVDLAKALADLGQVTEARQQFELAVDSPTADVATRVAYGRWCVSQADYPRAAELFTAATALAPGDADLPMFLAQVELLRGNMDAGWRAYARRDPRRRFEARQAALGTPYALPALDDLDGRHLLIVGEQGLGDELFFLRYAEALRAHGARLSYQGDARLHSLLTRTGLFESMVGFEAALPNAMPVLSGDLPRLAGGVGHPAPLPIPPEAARLEAMRRRLERVGPRPWIGVTWRAGTDPKLVPNALRKAVPVPLLFAAMPRQGTVICLQRDSHFDELESASRSLGRPLFDFSATSADLEDTHALVALLDRHIGVSNTNMHLAAAAGASADVLVPFPPEWRWGTTGESPWFPGFRVYRQLPGGDWFRALAELANAGPGSTFRV